jgi:pimeloyl-ACP methyl ester carboxylesterase
MILGRAILVHGMARTPVSMALLGTRLRRIGIEPSLFGYVAALERYATCRDRLARFIAQRAGNERFILIGHSLGTVLLRGALVQLSRPPAACFFIAPPTVACTLARRVAPHWPYRVLTGEMGQLLADARFMTALPLPQCPTWIYAGTAGPRGRIFPVGDEPNDAILKVSETVLPGIPTVEVRAQHTLIMNSRALARDLLERARAVLGAAPAPA